MHVLPINLTLSETLLTKINSKLGNSIKIEDYILNLINKDINSIILIKDNLSFDRENGKIYRGDTEIILTKTEYDLFHLLLDNCNNLVTFEEIGSVIWKNKSYSRFTLRNHIKHLRNKINFDLIRNHSNSGYIMLTD